MRTKYLVIGTLVLLVAVLFAVPSVQAKSKLADDEMDLVTAAGQPTIVSVGNGGTISFTGGPAFSLTLDTDSQTLLQALTLNNIVGEPQIANATNIMGNANAGGTQSNVIKQSWGSTYDFTAVSTRGEDSSADSSSSGDAAAGTQAVCSQALGSSTGKCGYISNTGSATANASSSSTSTTSVVSGAFALVSAYADQIFIGGDNASISIESDGAASLTVNSGAQKQLAALIVNNIVGQAQIANGTNIIGSSFQFGAGAGSLFFTGGTAGVLPGLSQSNEITQYRGTPLTRPDAFSTPVASSASAAASNGAVSTKTTP